MVFSDTIMAFVYYFGFLVVSLVVALIVGFVAYRVLDRVLDRLIEPYYNKFYEELGTKRPVDFSTTVSVILSVLFGVLSFTWAFNNLMSIVSLDYYTILTPYIEVTLAAAATIFGVTGVIFLIFVGTFFALFFSWYIYRMVSPYREDVASLLRLLLFIGLVYVVSVSSLSALNLDDAEIFGYILGAFVVLSIGWAIIEFVMEKVSNTKSFEEIKPFLEYFLFGIFILSALSVLTLGYNAISQSTINIFAWAFVLILVIALVPFVIKAIKSIY